MKRNYLQLIILLCVSLVGCQAQNRGRGPNSIDDSLMFVAVDTSYAFIRYDSNHLVLGPDSTAFRQLAKKWYRCLSTGEGHVNIVQIGASHVQGGTFPHRLRRNLLLGARSAVHVSNADVEGFPVSDRGMLFPYSAAAKCNNPFDYRVTRSMPLALTRNVYKEPVESLGLCGIAVTAADTTADIGIILNEPEIGFASTRITLLGEARGGVVPRLLVRDADSLLTLLPQSSDSLLRRYHYELPCPADSFHIVLPCTPGQSFALTGVYLANDKPGITFHAIGVNGASVGDYLQKCPYLTTDLQLLQPDLVIFGIGINDASGPNFDSCAFRRRYLQLVDSIRSVSPGCAFLFITNNDSARRIKRKRVTNTNGPLAREAFLRLGAETGGAVWDQFSIMGGLGSMAKWQDAGLAQRDRVHFTRQGYELLGDLLSNALVATLQGFRPAQPAAHGLVPCAADSGKSRRQPDTRKVKKESTDERPNYIYY